jgi:nucleoside-diphosphate-sugar epimerase
MQRYSLSLSLSLSLCVCVCVCVWHSTIHVWDLARAYVAVAENGTQVAGCIFNVADTAFPTTNQLAAASARYESH